MNYRPTTKQGRQTIIMGICMISFFFLLQIIFAFGTQLFPPEKEVDETFATIVLLGPLVLIAAAGAVSIVTCILAARKKERSIFVYGIGVIAIAYLWVLLGQFFGIGM